VHAVDADLNKLDESISVIEEIGKSFARRSRASSEGQEVANDFANVNGENVLDGKQGSQSTQRDTSDHIKRPRYWKPVFTSSSFVPVSSMVQSSSNTYLYECNEFMSEKNFRVVALWSRTASCASCGYNFLDEEIQASWDNKPHDYIGSLPCPRCSAPFLPMLGYHVLSLDEALSADNICGSTQGLPPQLKTLPKENFADSNETRGFTPYLNPFMLRTLLERCLEEKGEEILDRDTLRSYEPRVFWNLWWYCSRFSFPLPLPNSSVWIGKEVIDEPTKSNSNLRRNVPLNFCAFSSWDKSIALRGCASGARAVRSFLELRSDFDKYSTITKNPESSLLQSFSLQSCAKGDWEHQYLSQILVEVS
jgi:hypothetical protein